jgi:hypothetical protein
MDFYHAFYFETLGSGIESILRHTEYASRANEKFRTAFCPFFFCLCFGLSKSEPKSQNLKVRDQIGTAIEDKLEVQK